MKACCHDCMIGDQTLFPARRYGRRAGTCKSSVGSMEIPAPGFSELRVGTGGGPKEADGIYWSAMAALEELRAIIRAGDIGGTTLDASFNPERLISSHLGAFSPAGSTANWERIVCKF